jgi:hypothetical protein
VRNKQNEKAGCDVPWGTFDWHEDGKAEITLSDGKKREYCYLIQWLRESEKLFGHTIETREDTLALGGGGPRRVLVRTTSDREVELVELIEQLSADKDYAKGFETGDLEKSLMLRRKKKEGLPPSLANMDFTNPFSSDIPSPRGVR